MESANGTKEGEGVVTRRLTNLLAAAAILLVLAGACDRGSGPDSQAAPRPSPW